MSPEPVQQDDNGLALVAPIEIVQVQAIRCDRCIPRLNLGSHVLPSHQDISLCKEWPQFSNTYGLKKAHS